MLPFKTASLSLFDSTNASFRLSIETKFTKTSQNGNINSLVYVTAKTGIAVLNPNIYLVFTYKTDTYNSDYMLYTSYPQLHVIRAEMKKIVDIITNDDSYYVGDDGALRVKQEFQTPAIVANIGKQNKWISFKAVTIPGSDDGTASAIPGVTIEISTTNGLASVLTRDEFLTIYNIIEDLNLIDLQATMSLAYLFAENGSYGATIAPMQGQFGNGGAYQNAGNQFHQQPQQGQRQQYGGNNGGYRQPQYNSGGQRQVAAPTYNNAGRKPVQDVEAPARQYHAASNPLPPRSEEQTVMTFDKIDQTPIDNIDYDDDLAIANIFGDDE